MTITATALEKAALTGNGFTEAKVLSKPTSPTAIVIPPNQVQRERKLRAEINKARKSRNISRMVGALDALALSKPVSSNSTDASQKPKKRSRTGFNLRKAQIEWKRSHGSEVPDAGGQPRFEGGFRILQGGAPELGKCR